MVEDQTLIREMLRAMLELEPDIEVVGEAAEAEMALKELASLPVDLVFMDIGLPGMNGIQATQLLREMHRDLPIVMLTSSQDENLGLAIEAGATGYLLKTCTRQQLTQAVRDAYEGHSPLDSALTTTLLREVAELRRSRPQSPLSSRQLEILKRVASGSNYRGIAGDLFVSETTVNREMRNIFDQLGVNDAAHAVSEAYERGIL